jgi:outer membrane murein-binding lipoprotein Lpp
MSAIKRLLIIAIVVFAMLAVAGCLGQSDRDKAQDKYDRLVIETNDQIAAVWNVSNQQNLHVMSEPELKVWLTEYRSQVTALQNDVNVTNAAGGELKAYLSPGSSDYTTMTSNEESLQQNLAAYLRDYNANAGNYNSYYGEEHGKVPLL